MTSNTEKPAKMFLLDPDIFAANSKVHVRLANNSATKTFTASHSEAAIGTHIRKHETDKTIHFV